MTNLKLSIQYQRKLANSYQEINPNTGEIFLFELEMIERNRLKYLLPVELMIDNGEGVLRYDITGLQSIKSMQEADIFHEEELRVLLRSLGALYEELERYLLLEDQILLGEEQIYFNTEKNEVFFTYVPIKSDEKGRDSLRKFLDYLVRSADYKDRDYVTMLFGIFEKVTMENSSLKEVIKNLSRDNNDSETEKPMVAVEKAKFQNEKKNILTELPPVKKKTKLRTNVKEEAKDRLLGEAKDTFERQKDKFKSKFELKLISRVPPKIDDAEEMLLAENQLLKGTEVVFEDTPESMEENESERYRNVDTGIARISIDNREEVITKETTVIGKNGPDVDISLADPTVSRLHALIEQEEGEYSIKDLNSLNGTYVNGRKLMIEEKAILRSGDCIQLGRVSASFLS